jgi:hypothetical protein
MSDLRDSSEIEASADVIAMVWRPEYYKFESIMYKDRELNTKGKCCVVGIKFRGGEATNDVWLKSELRYCKFSNLDGDIYEPMDEYFFNGYEQSHLGPTPNSKHFQFHENDGSGKQFSDDTPF